MTKTLPIFKVPQLKDQIRTPTKLTIICGDPCDLGEMEDAAYISALQTYQGRDIYQYTQFDKSWSGYRGQKCIVIPDFLPIAYAKPGITQLQINKIMYFFRRLWGSQTCELTLSNQTKVQLQAQHFYVTSIFPPNIWFGPLDFLAAFPQTEVEFVQYQS